VESHPSFVSDNLAQLRTKPVSSSHCPEALAEFLPAIAFAVSSRAAEFLGIEKWVGIGELGVLQECVWNIYQYVYIYISFDIPV
jgi:hypothetical protein